MKEKEILDRAGEYVALSKAYDWCFAQLEKNNKSIIQDISKEVNYILLKEAIKIKNDLYVYGILHLCRTGKPYYPPGWVK